jgi:hypothetical protein
LPVKLKNSSLGDSNLQVKIIINNDKKTKAACYSYLIEKYKKEKKGQIRSQEQKKDIDKK